MKINFPPNALRTFQSDFSSITLFNEFYNNENNDQIPLSWTSYGINTNFFANGKDQILKLLILLGLAMIFKTLEILFRKRKGCFSKIIHILSMIFFLNAFILIYLFDMMNLCFFSFLNMKFKYMDSSVGILSLVSSIFFIIFTLFGILILCKLILGFSWTFRRKKPKVYPIINKSTLKDISFEKVSMNSYTTRNISTIKDSPTFSSIKRSSWWKDEYVPNNYLEDSVFKTKITKEIPSFISKQEEEAEKSGKKSKEDIENEKSKDPQSPREEKLNRTILILLYDYKQISKTQKIYAILLMIRYFILPVFIIGMYEKTYYLIACYFGFNVMFLLYIVCLNPFDSLCVLVHNIIIEMGVMGAVTGALMLYISELKGKNEYDDRIFNGSLIYYGNLIVILTLFFLYSVQILIFIWENIASFRNNSKVHILGEP